MTLTCRGKFSCLAAKVVSIPCHEIFDKQNEAYKNQILEPDNIIITIEAGSINCWNKYIGAKGLSLGIDKFGESAPYKEVYEHLNLSVEKIVLAIQERLRK